MPDPNTVTVNHAQSPMHARDSKDYTYKILQDLGDLAPAKLGESFTMWWWGDNFAKCHGTGILIKRDTLEAWLEDKKIELVEPPKPKRAAKEPKAEAE